MSRGDRQIAISLLSRFLEQRAYKAVTKIGTSLGWTKLVPIPAEIPRTFTLCIIDNGLKQGYKFHIVLA